MTFETKTLNCQKGGGIAAVIYNDEDGQISGGLSDPTSTTIPAVGITSADGQKFKNSELGQTVSIAETKGYNYLSGTSMSVPHVTGVIGKVWRAVSVASMSQHRDRPQTLISSAFTVYYAAISAHFVQTGM